MIVQNVMTAKIMGDILAEGMSLSGVDLKKEVNSQAVNMIEEIYNVVCEKMADGKKIKRIKDILGNQGIK